MNKNLSRVILLLLVTLFTLSSCFYNVEKFPEIIEVPEESTFEIQFIDVGQADSALVLCDGKAMLIDGGNRGDSNVIYSVLKNRNITHLDYIVATHAHEDHIGGLPGALNFATVGTVLSPTTSYESETFDDFKKYVEKQDKTITVPNVNDTFDLGSAKVHILAVNTFDDTNNTSIVLKITYGKTSFLFTGDAEREVEEVLVNDGFDLSSTLLKVGHHGSESSTSYLFLREVMPEYAIISVGEGNIYKHPTDEVLSRLRDAEVKTFRTDLQGDIICVSDGEKLTVTPTGNTDNNVFEAPENTYIKPTTPDTTVASSYILNTNSKKFHYADCNSVKSMSDKNKKAYNGDRNDLVSQGYSPCGNCKP